jgi:hypothetical protein
MQRFWSPGLFALAALALAVVFAAGARAEDKEKPKTSKLDMLKKLAGEWTGKVNHGDKIEDSTITYKVTAGGSAVVETIMPGTDHEMVTVYTEDGDDLVLTHYCMLHNQPHMKAERDSGAKKLVFKFAGGANIKADKDPHMHNMTMEFLGDDHIKCSWTLYQKGKEVHTAVFDLKRKKK